MAGDTKKQETQKMNAIQIKNLTMRGNLLKVYEALDVKNYNASSQIIGYLLTDDPTYITTYDDARSIMSRIDRYELLYDMLENYLEAVKKEARNGE